MKIVFFGTPEYVVCVLKSLSKKFSPAPGKSPIVAVVTQKPKPVGRKQILSYSPIDSWAHKHGVPIFFSPSDLISKNVRADVGILASYGAIIPKSVIDLFPHGILNIHPSLLPKYRGASPVQAAILAGDQETGVTIIKLDEKLDHGPIVSQFTEEILSSDTTGTLRARLFEKGSEVLTTLLEPYIQGRIKPKEQNDSLATFTKIITKQDGFINLKETKPEATERFVRAMDPWPGAWTTIDLGTRQKGLGTRRLKILKAHVAQLVPNAYSLVPDLVQLEGKTPVSWEEFKRGYPKAEFAKE